MIFSITYRWPSYISSTGSVVTWNVSDKTALRLVEQVLVPAAIDGRLSEMEVEDLEYVEDATKETSAIIGDTIILGTQASPGADEVSGGGSPLVQSHEADITLAKTAFSSGLARSTKLSVLENSLERYFESTRMIPSTLSAGSQLRFTRAFILRKTGELLHLRAQLNLYSEITDSLPDVFWDSRYELGLETYYDQVGRALDVSIRIKTLNEKMDYASEIAAVLRERLSEKHSTQMEWYIIGLIAIEVCFGAIHIWQEFKGSWTSSNISMPANVQLASAYEKGDD